MADGGTFPGLCPTVPAIVPKRPPRAARSREIGQKSLALLLNTYRGFKNGACIVRLCQSEASNCALGRLSLRRPAWRTLEALELFVDETRTTRRVDDLKLPAAATRAIRMYTTVRKRADEKTAAQPRPLDAPFACSEPGASKCAPATPLACSASHTSAFINSRRKTSASVTHAAPRRRPAGSRERRNHALTSTPESRHGTALLSGAPGQSRSPRRRRSSLPKRRRGTSQGLPRF
jgi:hypothetical protein